LEDEGESGEENENADGEVGEGGGEEGEENADGEVGEGVGEGENGENADEENDIYIDNPEFQEGGGSGMGSEEVGDGEGTGSEEVLGEEANIKIFSEEIA
jgi:hypothetical protein